MLKDKLPTDIQAEYNKMNIQEIKLTPTSKSTQMDTQDDLLMKQLTEFFTDKNHLYQMLPILNKQANISLRILDWFVTNYAKETPVIYNWNGKILNVYCSYKDQLKAYSKKRFDPFKRRWQTIDEKRTDVGIKFWYTNDKNIETTVGQLNFFKWAIQNGIIAYVVEHLSDLVDKMLISTKDKKKLRIKEQVVDSSSPQLSKPMKLEVPRKNIASSPTTKTSYTDIVATANKEKGEIEINATKTMVKQKNMKIVLSFT
jgi:hypothetical protein